MYMENWAYLSRPSKVPLSVGWGPALIQYMIHEATPQTASRYVQPLLQDSKLCPTDRLDDVCKAESPPIHPTKVAANNVFL